MPKARTPATSSQQPSSSNRSLSGCWVCKMARRNFFCKAWREKSPATAGDHHPRADEAAAVRVCLVTHSFTDWLLAHCQPLIDQATAEMVEYAEVLLSQPRDKPGTAASASLCRCYYP